LVLSRLFQVRILVAVNLKMAVALVVQLVTVR
jgi:hypothetical protein